MKLFSYILMIICRNEKKTLVLQHNNKLTIKGMNHKDHQSKSSKHSFVEINIISLTIYSSITKLNTENFEMMGLSNIFLLQ